MAKRHRGLKKKNVCIECFWGGLSNRSTGGFEAISYVVGMKATKNSQSKGTNWTVWSGVSSGKRGPV